MSARIWIAVPLLVLAACRPAGEAPPVAAWAADEAAIRAALQSSADAWNRGDLPGHLSYYVPEVTFMTANGPRPGVAEIEKAFAAKYFLDGKPRQELRFEQITVRSLGADNALATGQFILSGGGEAEQSGWFTTIWSRTPQGWRTIHDHSS